MGTLDNWKTDKELETNGKQFPLGDGVVICLARAGGANAAYNKRAQQLMKPYRRQVANGLFTPAMNRSVTIEAYADCVILGWEGLTDDDDAPIPFSRENCVRVMTDHPDLFSQIIELAEEMSSFKRAVAEEEAGN